MRLASLEDAEAPLLVGPAKRLPGERALEILGACAWLAKQIAGGCKRK